MLSGKKNVDIIGVQIDFGASKRGVNMGPSAIRYAGLCENIKKLGLSFKDKGDIIPVDKNSSNFPNLKNFDQVYDANKRLFEAVRETLKDGSFPVVLGGDHSIAAGSVAASASYFKNIGVIWIDAHGDFNNGETSPSGNMHGMPLSSVCGFGPNEMVDFWTCDNYVDTSKVVLIGQRDLDENEKKRLAESGVTVFSISDIDKLGMAEVVSRAIEIAGSGTEGIHVSFDIDSITPQEAPGVGTPVHSGLTVREAFLAAEMLAEQANLIAIDMVEVNPMLDERNRTGSLASELILSMLGKTVF